jgi:Flp pilus assembly protein TadD
MVQVPRGPGDSRAAPDPGGSAEPGGGVYEWYTRGKWLLDKGSPAAAAQVLEHAAAAEPSSRSIREALARAQFDARRYVAAVDSFRRIVEANPAEDYAHFGLGLALSRIGDLENAAEHLAIATAMCPENHHYATALRGVRAGLGRRTA